jgi:uncharacterized protein (DUF1501 family)
MKNCPSCTQMTRRQLIQSAGGWGAFAALARRGDAQIAASSVRLRGTAQCCLFINLNGAPSHLDTFDVKDAPWNPSDINLQQGAGRIVMSRTLFPNLSQMTQDLCLLRSVTSWEAEHGRGQFYLQTGHPINPAFAAETPHIGAVVALERKSAGKLPPFLALNGSAGQGASFLGGRMEPMSAPAVATGLATLEHNYYGAQSRARFEEKYRLLSELDAALRKAPFDGSMASHAAFYEAAREMMYDPAVSDVFKFANEDNLRYGNSPFGRSLIVARNTIQANSGTVFLTVTHGGWDTHQSMFDRNYNPNMYTLCRTLDAGVGALVEDLKSSGHFDRTLIVMMGEFGRTPGSLNSRGGRDHHKNAMSVAMMGGGVRGGHIIGSTDVRGDRVADPGWHKNRPIITEDIVSTIYSALGINWTKSITDTPSGRRFEYVPYAGQGTYTSIEEVFA